MDQRIDHPHGLADEPLAHQRPDAHAGEGHDHAHHPADERARRLAQRQIAKAQLAPQQSPICTTLIEVSKGAREYQRSIGASRGSP